MTQQTQDALRQALEYVKAHLYIDIGTKEYGLDVLFDESVIDEALAAAEPEQQPLAHAKVGKGPVVSFISLTDAGRALPPGKYDLFASPIREKKEGFTHEDVEAAVLAVDDLLAWCVKNVGLWHFPQYDWAKRAIDKLRTAAPTQETQQ